jgi:uncharacterized protein YndB with AHSA1/START domain
MLIRRPVAEVFEAFVDPGVTSRFWFSRGSGRLEPGKTVTWHWEKYQASADVRVKAVEPNARIEIEWSAYGNPTTVEWQFTARPDNTTFVSITNTGFRGDGAEITRQAVSSTEGFAPCRTFARLRTPEACAIPESKGVTLHGHQLHPERPARRDDDSHAEQDGARDAQRRGGRLHVRRPRASSSVRAGDAGLSLLAEP